LNCILSIESPDQFANLAAYRRDIVSTLWCSHHSPFGVSFASSASV
jgi:hypothetical protein